MQYSKAVESLALLANVIFMPCLSLILSKYSNRKAVNGSDCNQSCATAINVISRKDRTNSSKK